MVSDEAGPLDPDQNLLRENERLRRENRILKEERGIPKTVTGRIPPVRGINSLCYLRQRERLVEYAAAHIQHMQKALMEMNLQRPRYRWMAKPGIWTTPGHSLGPMAGMPSTCRAFGDR
jgi:hypothetical protein